MILDTSIVLAYALAMLLLGWYGMRRARNPEEFLVAGRNLGPACYLGTMAATVRGGAATVGTVRLGYVHGLSGIWLCAMLGGGILVPLLGAILWPRATTAGALASMLLGAGAAIVFMLKDDLDANTPIYFSLGLSLVSFVLVSLLTPHTQLATRPASSITGGERA